MAENKFKENWLKEDKLGPVCKQVTEKQKGFTKQNIKRLFSFKFDANEIIFTAILILVILLALSYSSETKQCKDWISPMTSGDKDNCKYVCNQRCELTFKENIGGNFLTNLTIEQDVEKKILTPYP